MEKTDKILLAIFSIAILIYFTLPFFIGKAHKEPSLEEMKEFCIKNNGVVNVYVYHYRGNDTTKIYKCLLNDKECDLNALYYGRCFNYKGTNQS